MSSAAEVPRPGTGTSTQTHSDNGIEVDDDVIDVENATVIDGAGVDPHSGQSISAGHSPYLAPGAPADLATQWAPSVPVGIPQSSSDTTSQQATRGTPSMGTSYTSSMTGSMTAASLGQQFPPQAYEPSLVSSSYKSVGSLTSHTPTAAPPWPDTGSYGGSRRGSFAQYSEPRSFHNHAHSASVPFFGQPHGVSGSPAGPLAGAGPSAQSFAPQSSQWTQPSAWSSERSRHYTRGGFPSSRHSSTAVAEKDGAAQASGSTLAGIGSGIGTGPGSSSDLSHSINSRRSLLSSMLAQSGSGRRRPSELSPYTRPTSRAGSRRGSFQKSFENSDDHVMHSSPNLEPQPGSSLSSTGGLISRQTSLSQTHFAAPHAPNSNGDGPPIFFPSKSYSTTDVSRTLVSTRTWSDSNQGDQAAQDASSAMVLDQPDRQALDNEQAVAFSAGSGYSPGPRPAIPSTPGAATPPHSAGGAPVSRAPSSSPPRYGEQRGMLSGPQGRTSGPQVLAPAAIYHRVPSNARLDIAEHPVNEVLEMMSMVLQTVLDKNDALYAQQPHGVSNAPELSADPGQALQKTLLSFHSSNIPAISLQAYLLRILKYCPTTNEVFIALLVYFDRISAAAHRYALEQQSYGNDIDPSSLFLLDSYNIHRLIIAGVTVASKFFSDIFYKNSRYAKVGGLPGEELNHLELQFLMLVDFKLMVSVEELQKYGDFLAAMPWQRAQ